MVSFPRADSRADLERGGEGEEGDGTRDEDKIGDRGSGISVVLPVNCVDECLHGRAEIEYSLVLLTVSLEVRDGNVMLNERELFKSDTPLDMALLLYVRATR